MGAVIFTSWSLFSAAGVGGESASPGDLMVSLFTVEFLPKIDPSRKWWCWPWKKFSFVFFLIVPKLRSAFLDLQFCRPWASNFCCNLSSFSFHAICEERWNRTWPPSTPGNFLPFFRIRRNFDNFIYFIFY